MPDLAELKRLVESTVEATVRRTIERRANPWATYRLQFHAGFTFHDAAAIVPYLKQLGISHVYASPYTQARAGSKHGYDVCDHAKLNTELGGAEGYRAFVAALREAGIGHILDIVPNHMAAVEDNAWWREVLENGPCSVYSSFFDIDWKPVKDELENRVLIPILGEQYGDALESGKLKLEHVDGGFVVNYYSRRLPIGPKTAIPVLHHQIDQLRAALGAESEAFSEYQSIITALEHLPPATATSAKMILERQREKEVIKRRLRELEAREPAVGEFIAANVELFNGKVGEPETFDRLDKLLQHQSYRLSDWRAASDEINYRRFFDINDLAALCIEKPEAFYAVNELVGRLVGEGVVDGLRIDHVDGLFAPEEYLWRLQWNYLAQLARREFEALTSEAVASSALEVALLSAEATGEAELAAAATASTAVVDATAAAVSPAYHIGPQVLRGVCRRLRLKPPRPADLTAIFGPTLHDIAEHEAWRAETEIGSLDAADASTGPIAVDPSQAPLYVLVEKILGPDEPLPESWPTAGTTGYDFTAQLNGLFVSPDGHNQIEKHYQRFTEESRTFGDVVRECKRVILRFSMSSELQMLAHRVNRLSEQHRKSRDFTLNALRYALREVLASFPVYRTYPGPDGVSDRDTNFVNRAVAVAKRRNRAMDPSTFDFIRDILLLRHPPGLSEGAVRAREEFAGKFQQVTSPIMAKGVEDTAFYVYCPLVSTNEVGGDPVRAANAVSSFHVQNALRCERQRRGLLATTTHDTKRSEDVRARIDVLSEVPKQWREAVARWSRLTRRYRKEVDGAPAPSPQDEYLFYQSLVGVFPTGDVHRINRDELIERLQTYMEKATREAKQRTSWINPHAEYDQTMRQFVGDCLTPGPHNRFLVSFLAFHRQMIRAGLYTALSQVVVKLMSPGVPDIYQGQELWDFSLVDPDNRRPVDYRRRAALLEQVQTAWNSQPAGRAEFASALAHAPDDERLKLFVTRRLLDVRRLMAEVFAAGKYEPLACRGEQAEHLIALAWRREEAERASIVVIVPRLWAKLATETGLPDVVDVTTHAVQVWSDTAVETPPAMSGEYVNLFTGAKLSAAQHAPLRVAELLDTFPIAVLSGDHGE